MPIDLLSTVKTNSCFRCIPVLGKTSTGRHLVTFIDKPSLAMTITI